MFTLGSSPGRVRKFLIPVLVSTGVSLQKPQCFGPSLRGQYYSSKIEVFSLSFVTLETMGFAIQTCLDYKTIVGHKKGLFYNIPTELWGLHTATNTSLFLQQMISNLTEETLSVSWDLRSDQVLLPSELCQTLNTYFYL